MLSYANWSLSTVSAFPDAPTSLQSITQAYTRNLPVAGAAPAILQSIVSVVDTNCVKVEAAPVFTSFYCPFEPSAQNPVEVMSAPSMMSSPEAKSMSKVQLEVNAFSTSAPANRTSVPAGISSN